MASRGIGIDIEEAEQAAKASMAEWYFGNTVFSKTCVRRGLRADTSSRVQSHHKTLLTEITRARDTQTIKINTPAATYHLLVEEHITKYVRKASGYWLTV